MNNKECLAKYKARRRLEDRFIYKRSLNYLNFLQPKLVLKKCPCCGKPFNKESASGKFKYSYCLECRRTKAREIARRRDPERRRELQKKYRANNPEKFKELDRQAYLNGGKERNAEWRKKNPERARQHVKNTKARYPEKVRAYHKQFIGEITNLFHLSPFIGYQV